MFFNRLLYRDKDINCNFAEVAVSIDAMNQSDVLGCVAGDDTVMIVCRDESCAAAFEQHLCSHIQKGE